MLAKLRYLTAGESHGQALVCIIEGIPSCLSLSSLDINGDLARRQRGFGRGGRMKIESDRVRILSGIRMGKALGSPISLLIENKDWKNWEGIMSPENPPSPPFNTGGQGGIVTRPRPGHADLSGALKYGHKDIRNVLERSSARETAARVAIGAVSKKFLAEFNVKVVSHVVEIGGVRDKRSGTMGQDNEKKVLTLFKKAEKSVVRCPDEQTEKKMIRKIKEAMKRGDSLGGVFEITVIGVPAGIGSYTQWDRRLNARLASAMMGTQAIKGVEFGSGFELSRKYGSEVMDEIFYSGRRSALSSQKKNKRTGLAGGFYRKTNHAGGIEGGISNGMPIVMRAAMKPIPTLKSPLSSVDINTKRTFRAAYERSDICAVPSAAVIGEAVTAIVIAECFLEKFGGDSMEEIKRNYKGYLKQIREF